MNDNYPSVDAEFIIQKIIDSGKVIPGSRKTIGTTTTLIRVGDSPIYKRQILLRTINKQGEISFFQATGYAALMGFMENLLEWLEHNKNWKQGEYL